MINIVRIEDEGSFMVFVVNYAERYTNNKGTSLPPNNFTNLKQQHFSSSYQVPHQDVIEKFSIFLLKTCFVNKIILSSFEQIIHKDNKRPIHVLSFL